MRIIFKTNRASSGSAIKLVKLKIHDLSTYPVAEKVGYFISQLQQIELTARLFFYYRYLALLISGDEK